MPPSYRLRLPRAIHEAMIAHALAERPNECCGLLGGTRDGHVLSAVAHFPLVNERASATRYLSDARSILAAMREIDRRGLDEVCVYHSHPTAPAIPSEIDLAENLRGDTVVHAIISLQGDVPVMRAWRLFAAQFEEASCEIVG